jgi:precorrin-6B methylase 2
MVKKEKKGKILSWGLCDCILDWLEIHPGDYLEIGCYHGVFLSEVAEKFSDIKVYGIDPHIADGWTGEEKGTFLSEIKVNFKHNIEGLNNITHWELKTEECLEKKYYNDISDISCVLIDGSHHYEDILTDIKFISYLNNKQNLMVVFDDIKIQDVIKSMEYFFQHFSHRIIEKYIAEGNSVNKNPNYAYFILSPQL